MPTIASLMARPKTTNPLIDIAKTLREESNQLTFSAPVAFVYQPLDYAWAAHAQYVERHGATPKRIVFLGMNPGPFGMMQTGTPFGEIEAVTQWIGIDAPIDTPEKQHPKRPILGYNCARSEVSGRRLWGLFKARYGDAPAFFADHWVANYCPLVFLEESGRNITPDKLKAKERDALQAICDRALQATLQALEPEFVVGVGDYAYRRIQRVGVGPHTQLAKVLHPSPASPAANRGWAEAASKQLLEQGVWEAT